MRPPKNSRNPFVRPGPEPVQSRVKLNYFNDQELERERERWRCRISMHYIRTHSHVLSVLLVLFCPLSVLLCVWAWAYSQKLGGKWASCNYFIRHSCRISTIFGWLDIIADIFGGQGDQSGEWERGGGGNDGDGRNCSQRPPTQLDALHILQSDINHNYWLDLPHTLPLPHCPSLVGWCRGGGWAVGRFQAHSSEDVY